MAKGSVIDMSDLKTDDILALTRRIASIWLAKLNLLPLTQSKGSWVCRKPPPFPSEYQPTPPPRSIRIPNTNSKRGLERLDPFHSMHYEFPSFTAHDFFDDDERQARVPRKWTDILGGPAEATLPLRYDWLLNSPGRSKRRGVEYSQNGGFCMMWTKLWQQRRFRRSKKTVRNCFAIKQSYAYQLRNMKTMDTMAYYKNHRSPWFDQMSEARQWLEEQEEIRWEGENIDRPGAKWSFEDNLMVEKNIFEDSQTPLHVGVGRLPDWLRNKKDLLALDTYARRTLYF